MEKVIEIKSLDPTLLLGVGDSNIRILEDLIEAKIIVRGNKIKIHGDEKAVAHASRLFHEMIETLGSKGNLTVRDIQSLNVLVGDHNKSDVIGTSILDNIIHYGKKGPIVPKTDGQNIYAKVVNNNDIVFSIGPAGTGKTYLSVTFAVSALESHKVDRIILCRPAVEAGESLGFLPGDLKDKVDPYLTPLYDALFNFYSEKKIAQLLDSKIIEVVPLAYMRGRTLDNAFMILDEAQNATVLQMKMFLTRLGIESKAIITGDITQVDLHTSSDSGLVHAHKLLKNIPGISFVTLDKNDVVRHSLVKKIIQAYEKK